MWQDWLNALQGYQVFVAITGAYTMDGLAACEFLTIQNLFSSTHFSLLVGVVFLVLQHCWMELQAWQEQESESDSVRDRDREREIERDREREREMLSRPIRQSRRVSSSSGENWLWYHAMWDKNLSCFMILSSDQADKTVVTKERLSGTYRLSAYWLAKMTSELPIVTIVPFCSWILIFLFTGLPKDIRVFLATTVTAMLGSFVGQVIFKMVHGVACGKCQGFPALVKSSRNSPGTFEWMLRILAIKFSFHLGCCWPGSHLKQFLNGCESAQWRWGYGTSKTCF